MTKPSRPSLRKAGERGSAIVIAIVVMTLMLGLGLAALAMTDTQTRQGRVEREREASFNLAEGALQQQSFLLGGRGWPRLVTDALPVTCDQGDPSTAVQRCPTRAALVNSTTANTGAFDQADYKSGASWTTYVRDNTTASGQVYPQNDATFLANQPRWDANGDGYIWVKSVATVRGRSRKIVALLKRDPIPLLVPKAVLVSGALSVGQNGQSPVISTNATTPPIVRCNGYGPNCADFIHNSSKKDPQVSPDTVTFSPSFPNLVSADIVAKIVDSAKVLTSCPSPAEAQGIVVIALASDSASCKFSGNSDFNTPTSPGIMVMRQGTLEFAGNGQFYGLILHLNEGNRNVNSPYKQCVQVTGTLDIFGGVVVEGNCGFYISGNARLTFAPNNLNFSVTGVAGLVQNTWRELPPGS